MSDIQITFQDLSLGAKTIKLITFLGQLDETNVDHEAKKVYQVITEMPEPVLFLDFSGLEYMNSKSIGYVTDWFTQASAKKGSISIIAPKPNILDILKVVGITQIITVYNSLEEAKAAFGGASSPAEPVAVAPAVPAPAVPAVEPAPMPAAPQAPAAVSATPATPAAPTMPAPAAPQAPAEPAVEPAPAPVTEPPAPATPDTSNQAPAEAVPAEPVSATPTPAAPAAGPQSVAPGEVAQ